MNIFFVDKDPVAAATYMVDKHVVKMQLETLQLLCTAHRVLDGTKQGKDWILPDHRDSILYKAAFMNHPSAIWVRQSQMNYCWTLQHLYGLHWEYEYRYGKKYKTYDNLSLLLRQFPDNIPQTQDMTPVYCAMPDDCKISENCVENYREYYRKHKTHLHSWKKRPKPEWI